MTRSHIYQYFLIVVYCGNVVATNSCRPRCNRGPSKPPRHIGFDSCSRVSSFRHMTRALERPQVSARCSRNVLMKHDDFVVCM